MSQVVGLPNSSYKPITNTTWVRARLCKLQKWRTRLAATSDKDYQLLTHGRWFSPGTPASSNTKTGRHDIAEILLKVALNTINQSINQSINQYVYKASVNQSGMCLVKSNLPILNVRLFGYLGLTLKKLEDTKWVFRSPNSKYDIQCNGKPKKKDKHRSTKHYIEHQRSMNTNPMKIGGQLMCYGRVGSSCSHEAPIVLLLLQTR